MTDDHCALAQRGRQRSAFMRRMTCKDEISPSYSVRPNGAVHQWRKDPPRELSVDPGS